MKKFRWPWQKEREQPKKCAHKYKDFPWYRDATYYMDSEKIRFTVYEPFVCVLCGHRVNKVLMDEESHCSSRKSGIAWMDKRCELIEDRLHHRAIVEDMIADMQLVDRRFLEICGMSEDFHPPPKIKVPK